MGAKLGCKMDPKSSRKGIGNDGEKKGNKMAKKSQSESPTSRGPLGSGRWGGGRERGKPLPRGYTGVETRRVESRHAHSKPPRPRGLVG